MSANNTNNTNLNDCARARLFEREGDLKAATDCYLKALSASVAPHERNLLKKKIRALGKGPKQADV